MQFLVSRTAGEPKDPDVHPLQCSWEHTSRGDLSQPLLTLWVPPPDNDATHVLTAWFKLPGLGFPSWPLSPLSL